MELLNLLQRQLDDLDAASLRRARRVAETACAPTVRVEGESLLQFCSNDYLGLANHPALVQALAEGATRYGVGSGASHLVSGHSAPHSLLEERLASWMEPYICSANALMLSSGYMANMGVLSALGGPGVELFSEELNHASLIDGARLSRARVQVFPHRDCNALAEMLSASAAAVKLVVTDSVFSMDGDLAPLPDLLQLCERYGAWLIVDDAHGFGVLGARGRGVLEHFKLQSPNLIYIGTLSKAVGVCGAFVSAHKIVIDWLVQRARQYIYTTASPPALAHAVMKSLDLIGSGEGGDRRRRLADLIRHFRARMCAAGLGLMESATAIQPLVVGSNERALALAAGLRMKGYLVPAIRPPTVAEGLARLRVTLSAAHSIEDLDGLCDALLELASASQASDGGPSASP